jgi:hypothetical protein
LEAPVGLDCFIQSSVDLNTWHSVTNLTTTQPTSIISGIQADAVSHTFYRAYSR